ncbi:glutamate-gated chloride channel-like isoform X7 [Macrobrachium rosenbergii]|uniref:glutamate-gated chloride channel-like isoform X7 n=1 Tax=Macrobrachium rosenbergii TaxID=79674 RepID=UPI0034D74F76
MEGASRGLVGVETLALAVILTLCCFCCCLSTVQASEYFMESSDKEILDFLLHKSRYDRRIRPPVEEGPLKVNVSVLLLSLSSPDESSLKYEVELLLHQHWIDPRLKHDDAGRHPYLSGIHHINDMWLPDTYFIMHGEFKTDLSKDDIALKIYSDGKVSYTIRRYLVLSCEGNLNKFPFDDPFCTFSMESISYERHELTYAWLNNTASGNGTSLAKSSNLRALNAYMIMNRTVFCEETFFWRGPSPLHGGDYSCLKVELEFTRDDAFYLSTVFFPGMVLVTSSFITFWLEWNAVPARVMIGVTTMLNFFTTSNSFRSTLPVVSNLSAMNLWDSVCMFFIYVSLLEFVVVNYVGRKRPKHNMAYMPGENAVIQVLTENRHRIPQAIHRIGLSLVSGWTERKRPSGPLGTGGGSTCGGGMGDVAAANRNSHELVSCANCGNSQCSHANAPNNCPNGEDVTVPEPVEVSQQPRKKDPPHPIRVAKSIDVISRIVFPVGYFIFLFYFFATYRGFG